MTDALAAAHSKNILHRDLKPANVLIGKDGRARLADFGLARVFAEEGSEATTLTGPLTADSRIVGTPGYMSPEQLTGKPLDPRSDIFCLAAVLYEMCTAQPAFARPGTTDWIDLLLYQEPEPISRFNRDAPPELARILGKALAKRPDERYQHASEMLADLRALRRRVESGHDTARAAATVPGRAVRGPGGRPRGRRDVGLAALSLGWAAAAFLPCRKSKPRQLTSSPGTKGEPALSPDDAFAAYSSDETGNPEIWLMDLKSGVPLQLTNDPASDTSPAWTPDGGTILFVSDRGGSPAVYKVPRLGGAPLLVLPDAVDPAASPDGTRIAFARPNAAGEGRIAVADLLDLAHPRILTGDADGLWGHYRPAWSPDGKTICYQDFRDLWLVPAAGGKVKPLTTDHKWNLEPVWSPDGRSIYFSSYRDGTHALWRIPASGGTPERVTPGTGPEGRPSVTRSGSRLAYSTYLSEDNLLLLDRRSGERSRIPTLRRANIPAIAADRSRVFFLSDRAGRSDLWVQPLKDGKPQGDAVRLAEQPGHIGTYSLSPDGKWIAYHGHRDGRRDIWIMPSTGGPSTKITENGAVNFQPSWSPDGTRLAYVSDQERGDQIWAVPMADGKPVGRGGPAHVGQRGPRAPPLVARRDANRVRRADPRSRRKSWIVRSSGSPEPQLLTAGAEAKSVGWDFERWELLVSGSWGAGKTELRRVKPTGGDAVPLAPPVIFGNLARLGDFEVSADGTLLIYDQEMARGEIWVSEVERGSF